MTCFQIWKPVPGKITATYLMQPAKEAMTLRSGRKEKRQALCLIGLTPHKDKGKGNTLLVLTSQKPCKLFRGIRQLGANRWFGGRGYRTAGAVLGYDTPHR
uniref:Uncharacterized protein n=1 Tax=Magallana gigas TaxID=29159 RepID=K1R454_MAGGI